MHTSMKPLFLLYITFFLGISSFLYTAQARTLPGCIMKELSKESLVMRSFLRPYTPPPPPKSSPSSPMSAPTLSSVDLLQIAQVASS